MLQRHLYLPSLASRQGESSGAAPDPLTVQQRTAIRADERIVVVSSFTVQAAAVAQTQMLAPYPWIPCKGNPSSVQNLMPPLASICISGMKSDSSSVGAQWVILTRPFGYLSDNSSPFNSDRFCSAAVKGTAVSTKDRWVSSILSVVIMCLTLLAATVLPVAQMIFPAMKPGISCIDKAVPALCLGYIVFLIIEMICARLNAGKYERSKPLKSKAQASSIIQVAGGMKTADRISSENKKC